MLATLCYARSVSAQLMALTGRERVTAVTAAGTCWLGDSGAGVLGQTQELPLLGYCLAPTPVVHRPQDKSRQHQIPATGYPCSLKAK